MKALPILTLCLMLPSLTGCSGESKADATAPSAAQISNDPNLFEVNHPEQFPLVTVETREVADQLDVNGVVAPDVGLTVHLTSRSGKDFSFLACASCSCCGVPGHFTRCLWKPIPM